VPQLADSLEAVVPDGKGGVKCSSGALSGGNCNLQPTKTTNYQFGTVYAGERLNIDADVYYINASNSTSVDPSTGLTNTSGTPAIYKGVEAQVSYLIIPHLTAIVNGSLNSAKNDDPGKKWLSQAPNYTALAGLVYNSGKLKLSYLHKFTGRQYADNPSSTTTNGVTTYIGPQVRIAPYSGGIASGTYYFGPIGVGLTVYNVFNDTSTTKIGSPTSATPLYFFQPGRSYEAQVRLRF
jgi:iron complex outermembrane receptor protein